MGRKPGTGVLINGNFGHRDTDTQEEGCAVTGAETGVGQPQARETEACWEPPGAGRHSKDLL